MSDKDRDARDRAIEETIEQAKQPGSEGADAKPAEEESLHDIVQRRMRERANEAARKRKSQDPSSGSDRGEGTGHS